MVEPSTPKKYCHFKIDVIEEPEEQITKSDAKKSPKLLKKIRRFNRLKKKLKNELKNEKDQKVVIKKMLNLYFK